MFNVYPLTEVEWINLEISFANGHLEMTIPVE